MTPTEPPMVCLVCGYKITEFSADPASQLTQHHLQHTLQDLAEALSKLQVELKKLLENEVLVKLFESRIKQNEEKINGLGQTNSENEKGDCNSPIPKITPSRVPHTCTVCSKTLSSRGALAKHMIQHQEKKPFQCDHCDKQFNQARDLKSHIMQNHSKERPFVCKECGKGFVHKFYLAEHMAYHTGERCFQCSQCGKRFQAKSALTKHMKRHAPTRAFICNQCDKAFTVKIDLTSHIKFVHEKTTPVKVVKPQTFLKQTNQPVNSEFKKIFIPSKPFNALHKVAFLIKTAKEAAAGPRSFAFTGSDDKISNDMECDNLPWPCISIRENTNDGSPKDDLTENLNEWVLSQGIKIESSEPKDSEEENSVKDSRNVDSNDNTP